MIFLYFSIPFSDCFFGIGRIDHGTDLLNDLMILDIDNTNIDKICD